MAREILLTIEQIEALQRLRSAANAAAALLGEDDDHYLTGRVGRVARDAEETLLIAMGHPPRWLDRLDREHEGTPLRSAIYRSSPLKWAASSILRRHGAVTLEEVSRWTRDEVAAFPGIGPSRLKEVEAALATVDLEFA
jgi:hypothetical protein